MLNSVCACAESCLPLVVSFIFIVHVRWWTSINTKQKVKTRLKRKKKTGWHSTWNWKTWISSFIVNSITTLTGQCEREDKNPLTTFCWILWTDQSRNPYVKWFVVVHFHLHRIESITQLCTHRHFVGRSLSSSFSSPVKSLRASFECGSLHRE